MRKKTVSVGPCVPGIPALLAGLGAVALVCAISFGQQVTKVALPTAPPPAPVRPVTDDYFGTKITDPYRYMEDLKNLEVAAWMKAQNDYTRALLSRMPARKELLARIKELDESAAARVSDVRRLPGDLYFYLKRLASEDVSKLYIRRGLDGPERLVADPMKLATPGGPHFSMNYYFPSQDGSKVAYGVSPGGSENAVMHIVEVATGKETSERIDRAWFNDALGWRQDGRSFFYNRLQKLGPKAPVTEREQKSRVFLHVIGTDPDKDKPVLGYNVSPRLKVESVDVPQVITIPGSRYAFGRIDHGVQNETTLYVAPLASVYDADAPWRKLCDVEDEVTNFAVHGDDLYLLTHKNASRFKITRVSISKPNLAAAEVVVPPGEAVIKNLASAHDALYVQLLEGGIGRLLRIPFDGSGRSVQVSLPFEGAVSLSSTDPRLSGTLLEMISWTKAPRIYAYGPDTQGVTDTKLQPAGPFDDPADVESHEVKGRAADGTLIPLSIVHKRGLKRDGSNSTVLLGYGSYGITLGPFFDPKMLPWLERGGVFAAAHVRGGGEYGEDWHRAGMKLTKPNTWGDFIACAEYLIAKGYTSPGRLGGYGASAGGITIGRAITERPDLFASAIDAVGMSDALRVEFSPNGPPNIPEFGSVKDPDGFKALYAMSAYHHVQAGTRYPAVMLTTGINDPRVVSWQAAKMAARLQAATASSRPVLLRVEYQGGHGLGGTKTQGQEEFADAWSFLLWQFGIPGFQPSS
jgi:prolyl oligopeptidase